MADFEFQSWERVSSEVTDGEASPHICEKDGDWLFRRCGELWFVRETARPGKEWNFAVPSHLVPPEERFGATKINPLYVGVTFWNAKWFASCCRLFRLGEEAGGMLAGWSQPQGWSLLPNVTHFLKFGWWIPFRLDTPVPVGEMSSSALFARLEEEMQDTDSDLRFSVRFASLSMEERALLGIATRVQTPQRFVQLMKCALRTFDSLWREGDEFFSMDLSASRTGNRFVLRFNYFRRDPRRRAIVNNLIRVFEPYDTFNPAALPSAIRTLTEDAWTRSLVIDVERPSQHDKLEAIVELRSWMEEHWAEGVKHLAKVV